MVFDGVQSALTGVLKGLGKQRVGGPVVVFSYYAVGLPLSYYLAFRRGQGISGLCWGTTLGTAVHTALYVAVVVATDFDKEVKAVRRRARRDALKRRFPTATPDDDSEDDEPASPLSRAWLGCQELRERCADCVCVCACGRRREGSAVAAACCWSAGPPAASPASPSDPAAASEKCAAAAAEATAVPRGAGGFWLWRGRGAATRRPSEYELVQSCTDSLAVDSLHDEEDGDGGLVTVSFGR